MAYSEDAVKAKLSALNETQESIVGNSQWIMFHRRHADKTAAIWLQRLRDSGAPKRLNLIYLANEVIQQSKARKRDDFVNAFSPIIADATATAYKGATNEVQSKIRRVVEVWKQRSIFEPSIQEAVEGRIAELDKSRSSGKKNLLGGNIFGSSTPSTSVPPELQPLQTALTDISKASVNLTTLSSTAESEYTKSMSGDDTPSPPVHAARLSALVKSLAAAESAANASATARQALITGLEALLATARSQLETDQEAETKFAERKAEAEQKKRDVEDAIMRGLNTTGDDEQFDLSTPAETNGRASATPVHDDDDEDQRRPEVEALTPPPVESFTPPDDPPADSGFVGSSFVADGPSTSEFMQPPVARDADVYAGYAPEEPSLLSPVNGSGHASKKRKMTDDGTFGGFVPGGDAMADLDADVAELLRSEGGGQA